MSEIIQNSELSIVFNETLLELDSLSRRHRLQFRLDVGRLLLRKYYDGDAGAYSSMDPTKPNSFSEFTKAHAEDLAELGLGEQVLRQCIVAHIIVESLPEEAVAKLGYSHVVALARVKDPEKRSELALTSANAGWKIDTLKQAVKEAKANAAADRQENHDDHGENDSQQEAGEETQAVVEKPDLRVVLSDLEDAAQALARAVARWQEISEEPMTKKQQAKFDKTVVTVAKQMKLLEPVENEDEIGDTHEA